MNAVDILYLLDQLEEVLGSGSRVPLTSRTLVDEREVLDILDQIRVSIPEEIKAARRLTQERDQVIADARAESDRLLREADDEVAGRVSDHAVVRAAESRAAEIEGRAHETAERVRQEAESYAYRVLQRLRQQIDQIGQAVDRGLADLDGAEAADAPPDDG